MNDTAKLGVALVGGYLLGRSKKAKTAVGLALWMAGSRYNMRPRDLAREGVVRLAKSPQAARIGDEVRGPLLDASRRAARAAVEGQLGNISSALQRRTEALSAVGTGGGKKAARTATKGAGAAAKGRENDVAAEGREEPAAKRKADVPEQRGRSSNRRPTERAADREPKAAPRGAKKAESRSKPAKSTSAKRTSRSKAPAKKAAKSAAGSRGRSTSSGSTSSARGSRSTSRSR